MDNQNASTNILLESGLTYVARGWSVLPLMPGKKEPHGLLAPKGFYDASTEPETLRKWWESEPIANVGIRTGAVSNIVVLDIDPRHGGDCSLEELEKRHGKLGATVESLTGGGGRHIFFKHPGGYIKSRTILAGLDVKADGGYIVAPPSIHASGRPYEWEILSLPEEVVLGEVPGWLLSLMTGPITETVSSVPSGEFIPEGRRNTTLTSLAGSLRRKGLGKEAILGALKGINNESCTPPLGNEELEQIAHSVCQYHPEFNESAGSKLAPTVNREIEKSGILAELSFVKLSDLLLEPIEKSQWLVDGMLPMGGTSIVGAKPKVGKSTLARNLAMMVATSGGSFLNRSVLKTGPVLYFAFEEKRSEIQEHFIRMGAKKESLLDNLLIFFGSAPEKALPLLINSIETHKPVLVIIDPLFRLVRAKQSGEYAEMMAKMEPVVNIARETGCHLMTVHHLGKGERTGTDALLGSTAIFGSVDTALILTKNQDGKRVIHSTQKYGDDLEETLLSYDKEEGWVVPKGDLETIQLNEYIAKVIEAIGDEELNETEIRERVGGNRTYTAKAIRKLLEDRQLIRTGEAKKGSPYMYRKVLVEKVVNS